MDKKFYNNDSFLMTFIVGMIFLGIASVMLDRFDLPKTATFFGVFGGLFVLIGILGLAYLIDKL